MIKLLLNPYFLIAISASYIAVFISGMVYKAGSLEAAFSKQIVQKQDEQIQTEIAISDRTSKLTRKINNDTGNDLDVIRSAIKRLHNDQN